MVALVPPVPAPTTIQRGTGWRSQRHLLEDALRDVVVAAPVGGALGVGELVHVVAAAVLRQLLRHRVDLAGAVDKMAAARRETRSDRSFPARCCAASPPRRAGRAGARSRPRSPRWSRWTLRPRWCPRATSRCTARRETASAPAGASGCRWGGWTRPSGKGRCRAPARPAAAGRSGACRRCGSGRLRSVPARGGSRLGRWCSCADCVCCYQSCFTACTASRLAAARPASQAVSVPASTTATHSASRRSQGRARSMVQ